jgi:hypothetical protein
MFISVRGQSTTDRTRNGGVRTELEIFTLKQIEEKRTKWKECILRMEGTHILK